jgi:hypothetical protein
MAAIGARIWLSFAIGCVSLLAEAGGTQAAVEISSKPTKNMTCSAGVCSPTARKAWLKASDLAHMLAASDVKVVTGAGATVIEVTAPLSWISANRLTLDSARSIIVKREIAIAGTGGLTLTTNDGGTDGILSFQNQGRVTFWDLSSKLAINGAAYTLVNSVSALAGAIAANPNGNFALSNDYDASGDGTYAHSPVSSPFSGKFEGLGNVVTNITINDQSGDLFVGFFDFIENATVSDFGVVNASVTGDGNIVGILAGMVLHDGVVAGCHTSGAVASIWDVAQAGGLAGGTGGQENHNASISRSYSTASVSGARATLGGLVGYSAGHSSISQSYATGNVSGGHDAFAGGFVGSSVDNIVDSYATGNARVGKWDHQSEPGPGVGGFVGYAFSGDSQRDYSTGVPRGHGADTVVGGFAGVIFYLVRFADAYWDIDTSRTDQQDGSGIVGLTDLQLKSALPKGFDPSVWAQDPHINDGYPYLRANPPPK